VQQVDLFMDGKFFRTLTNVTPVAGEALTASLNGYPVTYTVPTNASIVTVASGLAGAINAAVVPGGPGISTVAYGDRIELQASTNLAGPFFYVDHSGSNATRFYRTVLLPLAAQAGLRPGGLDSAGNFKLHVD